MKKGLYLLTSLLCLAGFFASCDIRLSDNGDLDGYWQLARVDTLHGGITDVCDRRLFWSVQAQLLQVSDLTYRHDACILRFEHTGSTLRVHTPYLVDHAGSDVPVSDAALLEPYGIQRLDETFTVERLDGKLMTLKGDCLRLEFNRY